VVLGEEDTVRTGAGGGRHRNRLPVLLYTSVEVSRTRLSSSELYNKNV